MPKSRRTGSLAVPVQSAMPDNGSIAFEARASELGYDRELARPQLIEHAAE